MNLVFRDLIAVTCLKQNSLIHGNGKQTGKKVVVTYLCSTQSERDSSLSHSQTNWARKRVIWWLVYELMKRGKNAYINAMGHWVRRRGTSRSTCKMKAFQNHDYILSTNSCEELQLTWNVLEIMHFVRQVVKAWYCPLYRICYKGQWITPQKDAA